MQLRSMANAARTYSAAATALLLGTLAGCGKAAPAGGPPAMPVEVVTVAQRPVEQTTEYVGTVKSRRSATVQPQVEGFITRILVSAGDRVRPGTPLMQIDAGMQQAAVANLESVRAARLADLRYAQQQATRMTTLLEAGASSKAEWEQAQTALSTSAAQLEAVEAQIREQRVSLSYHQVTAPTAGVLGDIPVRVGDSVTRSTVLTTIDQNAGLEIYINVPVQQAQQLRVGLPVHLVDDRGQVVSTSPISFVSPSVETSTQSVLAKALLDPPGAFRTDQFVRVQIVWTEASSVTAPIVALSRINGQFFAYVAEPGEGGAMVARQRAVEPGPIVGNDYVVKSGLRAGEKLIVSGVQKIRDGAPIQASVAGASPAAPASTLAGGKGR